MIKELISDLSILFVGTAFFSYLAVILRQPIIIAYILCGILVGPWGVKWIEDVDVIENLSHLGITLLLFLAGLCLHPQHLIRLFRKTTFVTVLSSLFSFLLTFSLAIIFQFSLLDSFCIGLAMMFSSTILAVKLLPTLKLHHDKIGALCIGVLIVQDLMAIAVLAFLHCLDAPEGALIKFAFLTLKLSGFIFCLLFIEQFVLRKVMHDVERWHELIFILGIAWCFGIAMIANWMGLFHETGAFFAGVAIARHPISRFISERLKPLRDFFLVLFFFSLGAKLNLLVIKDILLPTIVFVIALMIVRPWLFYRLFSVFGEEKPLAKEIGVRLGQLSEFSLLVAFLALQLGHISNVASQFIQLVTILTFVVSSYWVVFTYPTPIGTKRSLIRD